ncbi:MAG TPA: hypothetical protein VNQ99_17735 [Xanthobacteraceae bacterium]|nr:hypothetical protein [Xanthobacteraceae bacterium]
MAQVARKNEPDQFSIDAVNLSRIREAQENFHKENGSLRSVFSRAEAAGLHLPAAKRALKVIKSGKVSEMVTEFEKTIFYLKLLGKPVSKEQLDMFEGLTQSAPEDEKAGIEGLAAGRAGFDESQNPYDPGSPKGQSWLKRFREGKAERDLVLSMPEPQDDDSEDDED